MGKKILLAEDSLTIRTVFEYAFAQTDLTLTSVDNGTDAVRLAMETSPDLVIADVTLPGKDGFEVGGELRASEKTKSIPVLILAGSIVPFDEERFKKCSAAGVIFKPFESHEMLEKVQEILKGPEEAVRREKSGTVPAADEPWDFSDVLDEVSRDGGKAEAGPAPAKGEDLMPGGPLQGERVGKDGSLGEFDVSLEEIEEPPGTGPAPAVGGEVSDLSAHIEGDLFTDAPPPVTDISRAVEAVEEIEEIEDLDEVDTMLKGIVPSEPSDEPAAPAASKGAAGETVPEPAAAAPHPPAAPGPVRIPHAAPASPPAAPAPVAPEAPSSGTPSEVPQGADEADRALREQFAARANEIFEKVAAETVEKVLWETMDRFSLELTAKIRESVEAVAWEVIPATAETLIREEIARIRQRTEKKST